MTSAARTAIQFQVMWTRLVSVVEEQAQALLRTAFGSITREAGDLSAGVYDTRGRMLAQAVTGTPGHVNSMAMAVGHFLERFPIDAMGPGDVFVTNDPWMGTGHLFDYVMVTPAFRGDRCVALFASTCHLTDVGGRGFTADANSVFEEGVLIPHSRLRSGEGINETLFDIITANTRTPVEVKGDLRSLISCNDTGVARLDAMMSEFGLDTIDSLADHILEFTERAAREAIRAVPNGTYRTHMSLDGYEQPIQLHAALEVRGDHVQLDYSGSSPASRFGINSPKCYTDAYSCFGLKCVIAPEVPNNDGSLRCFEVSAEPGSCVAPERPSPVTARHVIGQMLPDVVFGCLAQALPERTPAESAGSIWVLAMSSVNEPADPGANASPQPFTVMNVGLGGVGAGPGRDGLSTTAFPSGVGAIPVEVTETEAPVVFVRKTLLPDSGGAGAARGGLSQAIEIAHADGAPFAVSAATWDRLEYPARGRSGGQPGRAGSARLGSGAPLEGKALHRIPAGDTLVVELPGGGGFGDPHARSTDALRRDLAYGYVSERGLRRDYGRRASWPKQTGTDKESDD
ncbi:MAG: hydantoinase B/oxoprolinase family protein [Gammaproteobacteria bacterium]